MRYSTELITFFRRLFHIRRIGPSFENPRYLLKWLFISTSIGLVAGVGALAFYEAIHLATQILLGQLVGYLPPDNELLFPRGSTLIEPGDVVTFLVSPSGEERLREYLAERVVPLEPSLPQQAAQR